MSKTAQVMPAKFPNLRFREFNDGWKSMKLIDLSKNWFSNWVFNDPKKVGKGFRIINVKDMYLGSNIDINNLTLVNIDEKEFLKNKVNYGDIFFTRSSLVKDWIACPNINLSSVEDLTYDGHLIRMIPNNTVVSPIFLLYNLRNSKTRKKFIQKWKTTTMTTIGQDDIASIEIHITNLNEQQKIADFLSNVDSKIEKLCEKKKLLETYKKWVMQKIFSREIRFKDGNGKDFPEWEERRLGEVCTIKKWVQLNRENFSWNWTYPVLNGGITFSGLIDKFNVSENTITISEGGNSCGYTNFMKTKFWCWWHCYFLEDLKCHIGFLYQSLKFNESSIMRLRVGSWLPNIQKSAISKLLLKIPNSKSEQKSIADFLSNIDEKIEKIWEEIKEAERFKKGLLQQMFI
jgi:type I restriction enzyme, S subunit